MGSALAAAALASVVLSPLGSSARPAAARMLDARGAGRVPGVSTAHAVPGTDCTIFPADNVWNTRVDALPVHEMSDVWLRSAHASSTELHPDFGPPGYGLPYTTVGRRHPKVAIEFLYGDESDRGPYPFDAHTPIEGGSDRHALIVERGTCRLFELYAAEWNGGRPRAGSGAIWDLDSNRLRPDTWTSADAAGLPILPGLVRWDEVKAGEIAHAIDSSDVQRYPIQLEWVINQYFEIDHYQPLLFIVDSFDHLFDLVGELERWMRHGRLDNVSPGEPAVSEPDLRSFLEAAGSR
jgi:hypothetical protein